MTLGRTDLICISRSIIIISLYTRPEKLHFRIIYTCSFTLLKLILKFMRYIQLRDTNSMCAMITTTRVNELKVCIIRYSMFCSARTGIFNASCIMRRSQQISKTNIHTRFNCLRIAKKNEEE